MIDEVLLVHHSHTDIGYTHPQPVVMELQRRFLDGALDLADATADWPDGSRFEWTCEVTGVTLDWWRHPEPGGGSASWRVRLPLAARAWRGVTIEHHSAPETGAKGYPEP